MSKYLQALGIQTWQERNKAAEPIICSAQIIFISDSKEFNGDQASAADTLFTAMLNAIQLKREDVQLINLSKEQFPQLDQQINAMNPRMIIAMGSSSAHYLLQTQDPLDSLRNKIHTYAKNKTPLMITYPPAHLLRYPADKRKSYQDLLFLKQTLD